MEDEIKQPVYTCQIVDIQTEYHIESAQNLMLVIWNLLSDDEIVRVIRRHFPMGTTQEEVEMSISEFLRGTIKGIEATERDKGLRAQEAAMDEMRENMVGQAVSITANEEETHE